jgi:hypothetical protein
MFKVNFTASVKNFDTEEDFNGWVDPQWSMSTLHSEESDVRSWEFDTLEEAIKFIDSEIGSVETRYAERGNYYAQDSELHNGEYWYYCGHVTEV